MGRRRKKQWRKAGKVDVSAVEDAVREAHQDADAAAVDNDAIFFEDREGVAAPEPQQQERGQENDKREKKKKRRKAGPPESSQQHRQKHAKREHMPPAMLSVEPEYDLWDSKAVPDPNADLKAEGFSETIIQVVRPPRRKRASWELKKGRKMRPLQAPHSGTSMNPLPEEHQATLRAALAIDERERKQAAYEAAKLRRELPEQQPKFLNEEELNCDDDDEGDEEGGDGARQRKRQRKTKADRNRRERHKAMEQLHAKRREEKRVRRDADKVSTIVKEIARQEREQREKREAQKALLLEKEKTHVTKLGPEQFEEGFPDVALTEEFDETRSLRNVPVTGSVARGLFKRMQKQQFIEARTRKSSSSGPSKRRRFKWKEVRIRGW